MEFDWVEWFGYLASLVVLVSLTMTSIIKLRVINFIGCILFALFAYFIDSYPTMFMNLGIAGINIYFLHQIYSTKEKFKIIAASVNSEYFDHFVSSNQKDIELQTTLSELNTADTAFYMLRNNSIAGVLVGNNNENGELSVMLDYVTPEYRDMKIAHYYYDQHPDEMKKRGINVLLQKATEPSHVDYLVNIGFELVDEASQLYKKTL